MTHNLPPPMPSLLPETAPFSAEQRAWLNGFFSGYLGLGNGVTALSPQEGAALMAGVAAPAEDGDAPWHDQTLALAERMKLADGRPLRRRMMAAMGQQDCGQCGYTCADYSDAIFAKKEARLNLCVPGGKETLRALKTLYEELDSPSSPAVEKNSSAAAAPEPNDAPAVADGRSRDHPVDAVLLSRTRLNKPGSGKETWHIELDLSECGLDYVVGDCFGIFPTNERRWSML